MENPQFEDVYKSCGPDEPSYSPPRGLLGSPRKPGCWAIAAISSDILDPTKEPDEKSGGWSPWVKGNFEIMNESSSAFTSSLYYKIIFFCRLQGLALRVFLCTVDLTALFHFVVTCWSQRGSEKHKTLDLMMRKMSDQEEIPTRTCIIFFFKYTFAFVLRRSRSPWQGRSRISPREWTAFFMSMLLWLFQFAYLKKLKKQLIQIEITSMLRIMFMVFQQTNLWGRLETRPLTQNKHQSLLETGRRFISQTCAEWRSKSRVFKTWR